MSLLRFAASLAAVFTAVTTCAHAQSATPGQIHANTRFVVLPGTATNKPLSAIVRTQLYQPVGAGFGVTFTIPSSCGTFQGGTIDTLQQSIAKATTDDKGVATAPPLAPKLARSTYCEYEAKLDSAPNIRNIGRVLLFKSSEIRVVVTPWVVDYPICLQSSCDNLSSSPPLKAQFIFDTFANAYVEDSDVTFAPVGTCGNGVADADLHQVTDSSGTVSQYRFNVPVRVASCQVEARLDGTDIRGLFTVRSFDPAQATIVPSTLSTTVLTHYDSVLMELRAADGHPVVNVPLKWRAEPLGAGPGGNFDMPDTTDDIGKPWMIMDTNGTAGTYRLIATVGRVDKTITVTQSIPPLTSPPGMTATKASGGTVGGLVNATFSSVNLACAFTSAKFTDPASPSLPAGLPDSLAHPHSSVDFRLGNCGAGQPLRFSLEFPDVLPPTAQFWKYGPTPENRTSHWYPMPSSVDGKFLSFTVVDGGLGDDDLTADGSISLTGTLAVPGGLLQDLWWSGAAENGWGMTIAQHRDVLFANLFVYDDQGNPVWYVMSSGKWNDKHTEYTGDVYLPRATTFFAYKPEYFFPVQLGTATIKFHDANLATLTYTTILPKVTMSKMITRIPFGPVATPPDRPRGDLWWGGTSQNGWGVALMQQYDSLFALWYSYDDAGNATWYVAPGGTWNGKDDWSGKLYKPTGAQWFGAIYDASRHRTTEVGMFRFRFAGESATWDYALNGKTGSMNLSRVPF